MAVQALIDHVFSLYASEVSQVTQTTYTVANCDYDCEDEDSGIENL
jgi:hypothetical protein